MRCSCNGFVRLSINLLNSAFHTPISAQTAFRGIFLNSVERASNLSAFTSGNRIFFVVRICCWMFVNDSASCLANGGDCFIMLFLG